MITHQNNEPRPPSRVVVLGAGGFIGSAIFKQLKALEVPIVVPSSSELNLINPAAGDKLASWLTPSDAVVMLAALTPDKGRDIATFMKNLAMMQNVCTALEKSGCVHFVYFSSDAVYDTAISCVNEDTSASPQDLYGIMHYAREIMARSLKTAVLILRPTLVYGLGDTHNSYGPNRFRRMAEKDNEITLFGEGEDMRDHIHVNDVAAIAVRCLFQKSVGTLNVATGVSKSFFEVAEIVAKQFQNRTKVITTPRINPITQRHYNVTSLIKAFPDFQFTLLEDSIV